jgi:acetyl-CoA synthetase
MLHSVGIVKGSRVALYLPMVPEIVVAMLACARIGAVHSIVVSFLCVKAFIVTLTWVYRLDWSACRS